MVRASGERADVLIVGGGIAGLSAALRLAERGASVTLLETRKKLGGRATSFVDVRSGETLDNCQHVALGCCTNYLDLCARLGVAGRLRWTDSLYWVEAGGRVSEMKPGVFPAPGHFTESFLTAAFLTLREKTAVARAMLAMLRGKPEPSAKGGFAPGDTFGAWLRAHGQPERVIRVFWAPVIISACNLGVERVATAPALKVFREGFLATRTAASMAVAAVPLVELYDPAEEVIRRAGGEIRLGESVERVGETWAELSEGGRIEAGRVILAVPPERAKRLVDAEIAARDERFAHLDRIEHSPILGVHLTFDGEVTDLPHATLVDRPTQWLFNKGAEGVAGAPTQRLHAVISAADDWMPLTEEEIGERVMADIRACFPRSGARLARVRAVKEKRATFAPTPEVESIRPDAVGASRLILAGDYTTTGWPATMEGATRSGYIAAAAALGETEPRRAVAPDLRPAVMVRAMAAV